MPTDRRGAGCALLVLALCASTDAARAELQWRNHLDASAINEIVLRDNLLYMATFGGLVVYDPARGTFAQYDNTDGLTSNALTCLAFTPDGTMYIGAEDIGVTKARLAGGRLLRLRSLNEQIDGLSSNAINSIAVWGTDVVYGATPGAGTIRNDFASARYFVRDGLPADNVKDVMPDGDVVWMATDNGVVVLDRLGLLRRPRGGPAQSNVIGSDGTRIWVGTSDGVWRLNPGDSTWTNVGPATRPMDSLFWDGTTMWAGSTRNLFRYTGAGTAWTIFRADSLLSRYGFTGGNGANRMKGLAVVASGDVYMGGIVPQDRRGAGLIRFNGTNIENIFSNTPGANNVIRLSQDTDGSMWASFRNFYVGKLTPSGTWVNYNSAIRGIQLPGNQSTNATLLADSDGIKWFCGFSRPTAPRPLDSLDDRLDADYANDVWQRHPIASGPGDGLGSLRLQRAVEDPAGNRWFLSDAEPDFIGDGWWGIHILSKDRSEWLQMNPAKDARMLAGNVVDVAFGPTFAYVGLREEGVQVWGHLGYDWPSLSNPAGDAWSAPVSKARGDIAAEAQVNALELRSDRVLWIATSAGLYRFESGRTRRIPVYNGTSPGILNSIVQDLALDHDENLWVATDFGLNRIARDDESDIRTYTTTAMFVTLSGLRYPLDIISPLAHANCLSLAMDRTRDVLYVGTFGGLSVLDIGESVSVDSDLSRAYVYPNPVYGRRGHQFLKIENISGPVSVEIYTVEGQLVHSQDVDGPGQVIWDLTTRSGFLVGSGNYLVRITGAGGSVVKPVAVLR